MLNADLLAYGYCANAGDVLIFEAMKSLFDKDLNYTHKHIRLDKLGEMSDNIVIGPGGILSGSYDPANFPDEWLIKFLDQGRVDGWKAEGKKLCFFGTGTNTPHKPNLKEKPFSAYSETVIRHLIALSSKVYLRGSYDIAAMQRLVNSSDLNKLIFQPCPSLFIRNFTKEERIKVDEIAINLPFNRLLTQDNYKKSPINKLVAFAKSNGLKIRAVPNHADDINKYVYELFDSVDLPDSIGELVRNDGVENKKAIVRGMTEFFKEHSCIFSRYSGYRFNLGSRLHSFLPFMAFDTPSIFLTPNTGRMSIPHDYFGGAHFLAKYPYSVQNADKMIDSSIERLEYFMKHENELISLIREKKEKLWHTTVENKQEMLQIFSGSKG